MLIFSLLRVFWPVYLKYNIHSIISFIVQNFVLKIGFFPSFLINQADTSHRTNLIFIFTFDISKEAVFTVTLKFKKYFQIVAPLLFSH